MPVFEIALPDGRAFEVEAPDQQSAYAGLQSQLAQEKAQARRVDEASSGVAGKVNAFTKGVTDMAQNVGETLQQYVPGAESAGQALKASAAASAPKDYKSEPLYTTEGGLKLANAGNVLAENAPGIATAATLAKLGSRVGGWKGALAALAASAALQNLGGTSREVATAETGDPNAQPTTAQKLKAAGIEAVAAPVQAAGQMLLGPVGRFPGRLLTTAAADVAGGGASEAVREKAATGTVDPGQVINAGLTQGLAAGAITAPRAVGEVATSRLAKRFDTPELRPATNAVFDDLRTASGDNLTNTRAAGDALRQVTDNYRNEIAAERQNVNRAAISQEADNALARAGQTPLSTRELQAVDTIGNANLSMLARKASVARMLPEIGTMTSSGKFVGGVSSKLENGIRLLQNPIGAGVAAATGSAAAAGALPIGPGHAAALGALWGGSRLLDAATGARSPLGRLSSRFGGAPLTPIMAPPPPPPPPGGPNAPRAPGAPWGRAPTQTVPNVGQPLRTPGPAPANYGVPAVVPPGPRGAPPPPGRVAGWDNPLGASYPMSGPGQPRLEAPPIRMPGPPGTGFTMVPPPQLPAPRAPLALPKPSALYTEPPGRLPALPGPPGSVVPTPVAPLIEKVKKSNGKVKETPAPAPAPAAPAASLDIPDFLRRAPARTAAPAAAPAPAAPAPLEDLNPPTRPQPKPRSASVAKEALDTLLKRQAERDAQRGALSMEIPDFLRRSSKATEAKQTLEAKATTKEVADWVVSHDKAHMTPWEAANAIADMKEAKGEKYNKDRRTYVNGVSKILTAKNEAAAKIAKASGLSESDVRHTLWAKRTRAEARDFVERLVKEAPKAEDVIRSTLEPKIEKWWRS